MTISQIIIFVVLFILDFWLSVIRPIYKDKNNPDGFGSILSVLRMLFIYGIAVSVTFGLNKERKNKNCPEYEQVIVPLLDEMKLQKVIDEINAEKDTLYKLK